MRPDPVRDRSVFEPDVYQQRDRKPRRVVLDSRPDGRRPADRADPDERLPATAFVNGKGGLAFGWAIKSDGSHAGFSNRTTTTYTGTVYLQVNMGAPSTRVITSGDTNVFSLFYRVIKTPIGPSGDAP
jgi:hypothetical protein